MTQIDLGLGGGYVYQWECAILLAINYLMDALTGYNPELHRLINDFLGRLEAIHLEGKEVDTELVNEGHVTIELEDINLLSNDRAICIQVRAKEEGKRWIPSDPLLEKAVYHFYRNQALDEQESPIWFVFLSNRGFNPRLVELKKAIAAGTAAQSAQADALFHQLQKYVTREDPKAPALERQRFDRLLSHLAMIEFLAVDEVKPIIQNHLRAQHIHDWKQAYESLFTEFSKRSVLRGGSTIALTDLYDIVEGFFTGCLTDYILTEPRRSVARYVLHQAETSTLPPFGVTSTAVTRKIEAIIGGNAKALNETEAFILLVATSLPHLLHRYDEYAEESVSSEQVCRLAEKLDQESSAPDGTRTILVEVAFEASVVANARTGFELEDTQYNDSQVRDVRARLRLLAALLHLADYINLDQAIDPTPPQALEQASWSERCRWWRQAYVCGVSIESQRLRLHIRLPKGREEEYSPILVDPLDEETRRLIDTYDPILFSAGINLKYLNPVVTEGDGIPTILDDEWRRLKQEIEAEQFSKSKDRLQQDVVRAQRLRESRVNAQIGQAERMVTEGRHLEAAEAFALAAALLARAREAAQARRYAVRAAKQYLEGGDRQAAAQQYLQAAEVWLNNASTPELVTKQLEQAHKLAVELDTPALQVRVLLAQAWVAFATLCDPDANRLLEQANELLPKIADDAQRARLLRKLALQHAILAMVWEKWDIAQEVLKVALSACPKAAQDERLDLLQGLLQVSTECGDWETADRAYQQARQLLDTATESLRQGILAMHYGASLARRGALKEAYEVYDEAIQQLDGHADAYTLGLVYRNMQFMLLRNGALPFDFGQSEARRIDLFKSTQIENRGYANELRATADFSAQEYRGAMQYIRLALAHYWREGAWMGIEHAYQTLAALNAATGRTVEALLAAIRASDSKAAELYSKALRDTGDKRLLAEVVGVLASIRPAACEQKVAAKALGILADVIPPMLLKQVADHLLLLVQGPEDNQQHIEVRRYAAEALRHLVPQLDAEQTNTIVRVVLDQLRRQQFWTITEELLNLLYACFAPMRCQIDTALYALAAEAMLTFSGADHFRSSAESVAVRLACTAPSDVRAQVVAHLRKHLDQFDCLSRLADLKEPIPKEQLDAAIDQILSAINPKPEARDEEGRQVIRVGIAGISPRMINKFNEVLPPSLYDHVIDGLLEAIINEHNVLAIRSDAIQALSDLPTDVLAKRADEIADYLLWGADGTLPRSSLVDMGLQSQSDPFSAFRISMGNIEQVRRSSLRALGRLYPYIDRDHQECISARLIAASRDASPIVRQGVAVALDAIKGDVELPTRLLLVLVVLLHDPDSAPCSWACAASGHLVARRLADPFAEDLIERLLNLAEIAPVVDVRVGTAIGLRAVAQSEQLGATTRGRVLATLKTLSNDVSFRVRREVAISE